MSLDTAIISVNENSEAYSALYHEKKHPSNLDINSMMLERFKNPDIIQEHQQLVAETSLFVREEQKKMAHATKLQAVVGDQTMDVRLETISYIRQMLSHGNLEQVREQGEKTKIVDSALATLDESTNKQIKDRIERGEEATRAALTGENLRLENLNKKDQETLKVTKEAALAVFEVQNIRETQQFQLEKNYREMKQQEYLAKEKMDLERTQAEAAIRAAQAEQELKKETLEADERRHRLDRETEQLKVESEKRVALAQESTKKIEVTLEGTGKILGSVVTGVVSAFVPH